MKEQIVIRTFSEDSPIALAKKFMEGYTVVICNPIGEYLEYILEKEIENPKGEKDEIVGTWIIEVTDDKYHYKCSNCSDRYTVLRKCLGNTFGEEYKFAKNYCSCCGVKMEHIIHEW